MLKLFNTLTRKKEVFQPLFDKTVGYYTCGPTVYDYAHIGNLRTYVFEDILKRTLEYFGYKVKHVMNITDVGHLTSDADTGEDKMQKALQREGLDLSKASLIKLADKFTEAFKENLRDLNVLEPQMWYKATEHINDIIEFIQKIVKNGFTYETAEALYFDSSKYSQYKKLAQLDIEGLEPGIRVEIGTKKNITDFALWLKAVGKNEKHIMQWPSPWGKGFPGWHIECSTISTKYLGEQFDIHAGGVDLIPIHHTNERAQSYAAFSKESVQLWMHGAFLVIDQARMGKSQGNFISLDNIKEKGYSPLDLRYLYLTAHYRQTLNFSMPSLNFAQESHSRLAEFILRLLDYKNTGPSIKVKNALTKAKTLFDNFIQDDLNVPRALATIFELVRYVNDLMDKNENLPIKEIYQTFLRFDRILGLSLDKVKIEAVPVDIEQLIKEREKSRKKGDFTKADAIRKQLEKAGVELKDTNNGPRVKIKK